MLWNSWFSWFLSFLFWEQSKCLAQRRDCGSQIDAGTARLFFGLDGLQFDAQTGADNIAAAWDKLTDQIGREKQIALYRASLGL